MKFYLCNFFPDFPSVVLYFQMNFGFYISIKVTGQAGDLFLNIRYQLGVCTEMHRLYINVHHTQHYFKW